MPDRYGESAEPDDTIVRPDYGAMVWAIANCGLCDADGYRGSGVCDHVDHGNAARRGMDLVRKTMGWK